MVEGKAMAIGFGNTGPVTLDALSDVVLATAALEGVQLPLDVVRSAVMRRLGLTTSGPFDRQVDGLVEVINDATTAFDVPLDEDRLCRWQSALFPGGTSGIHRIAVGRYRDHDDPMQIVSGAPGREVVHYEAPPSADVPAQMNRFLAWFAEFPPAQSGAPDGKPIDGFARAAIAHLWFESIHPFEDGNGRIGRAIVDMAIAQHLRQPVRLYSLSRQLLTSRSAYYDALNQRNAVTRMSRRGCGGSCANVRQRVMKRTTSSTRLSIRGASGGGTRAARCVSGSAGCCSVFLTAGTAASWAG